jgi:uncharacterized protein YkwD
MQNFSRYLILMIFTFVFYFKTNAQQADITEALNFLNDMRSSPSSFSKIVGVPLNDVKPMPALRWNQILANVAQKKAQDMANRNYFDHVNPEGYGINYFIQKAGYKLPDGWTDNIANNFCESISAGTDTPKEGIINLINDGGYADHKMAGHRLHLLGIDEFYAKAYDVGIGWGYNPNSTYKYYLVVITARHEW